ncbi:prepilin-type N-terminal cleavage/methylation domain-containing protein [Alkalihalobacillus trypoxylicola]|uniref:Type II secretion system protein n=1 Tax=Alkalihalobacillus trypoxylicola TaxID=519424 RepID=A0A162DVS7_9BACI|nr:prepilin-type N-terminal cleavage/methylation domain-containing protein [Alkalihalobacillus trypoxylicola]KYG30987.1 hypothetical protein AZF04_18495 [Alkalihalobacillus trypoxylicola]
MKSTKGFTLIEVLLSFFIFTMVGALLIPMIIHLQHERLMLLHKEEALYKAEKVILHHSLDLPFTPVFSDSIFTERWINNHYYQTYCVSWEVSNQKDEVCLPTK